MSTHTAVLLLGSNVTNREAQLSAALDRIDSIGTRRRVSALCTSADVAGLGNDYANITATYTTRMSLHDFCDALAHIERSSGRTASSKYTGVMPLDIDVVIWDGTVVSPDDYSRPYFEKP